MASFGHVAVGLLTGRLHGGRDATARSRRCSWGTLLFFAALASLPDLDVALVALGAADGGAIGHRGASHSLGIALLVALLAAAGARRFGWPVLRTALAAGAAVASHTLLDLLGARGQGLAVLWPLSTHRFHSPWRVFPDAPRGMKLLSWHGIAELVLEFGLFLPVTLYALWPRITARVRGEPPPHLRVIAGNAAPPAAAAPSATTDDAPMRSSG
ncbi:MAG TPA: metal-dependent hydrolase [Polyangia bacterium]|nr:metal-dependent hydrolase [Polyangia bacterium]